MYEIEKGIAIPDPAGGGRVRRAPWRDMEVGDSVLLGEAGDKAAKFSGQQNYAQRVTGFKFAVRSVADGVRIWRVA